MVPTSASCSATGGRGGCSDLDGNSVVDGADLGLLLGAWGACPVCPGEGDCCVANGTPGCNDTACCDAVCGQDAFCCDVEWDGSCAAFVCDLCTIECCECDPECNSPCPGEGDCCAANGSPGCDDATCCQQVCALDAFCCERQWDGICAGIATNVPACGCEGNGPVPRRG